MVLYGLTYVFCSKFGGNESPAPSLLRIDGALIHVASYPLSCDIFPFAFMSTSLFLSFVFFFFFFHLSPLVWSLTYYHAFWCGRSLFCFCILESYFLHKFTLHLQCSSTSTFCAFYFSTTYFLIDPYFWCIFHSLLRLSTESRFLFLTVVQNRYEKCF